MVEFLDETGGVALDPCAVTVACTTVPAGSNGDGSGGGGLRVVLSFDGPQASAHRHTVFAALSAVLDASGRSYFPCVFELTAGDRRRRLAEFSFELFMDGYIAPAATPSPTPDSAVATPTWAFPLVGGVGGAILIAIVVGIVIFLLPRRNNQATPLPPHQVMELTQMEPPQREVRQRLEPDGFGAVQRVIRLLGSGDNGAVLECDMGGQRMALKVLYNRDRLTNTTMVAHLHETEYRFLNLVPEHSNIVVVRSIISARPLTQQIVEFLPPQAQLAAQHVDARFGRTTYRSTSALVLELLPRTLHDYVVASGATLGADEIVALGVQVASALLHLQASGVLHGDIKLTNLMVAEALAGLPPRVVLVDFGCAVLRGNGANDMDADMQVHASAGAANFALGNESHLAPEVLNALRRRARLPRDSTERVAIPLTKQPSFELGVVLFEIAMGTAHPMGVNYPPAAGADAATFASVNYEGLGQVAGTSFAQVVRGMLAFDPDERTPLGRAQRHLAALVTEAAIRAAGVRRGGAAAVATRHLETIAENFVCPITADLMEDPVICAEGQSFERAAIVEWLRAHATNPVTRNPLTVDMLHPNLALRASIEGYNVAMATAAEAAAAALPLPPPQPGRAPPPPPARPLAAPPGGGGRGGGDGGVGA